jgi:hypothetical protein
MLLEDRFTVFRVLSFTGQTYYGRLVNREPIDWLAFDDGPGIDSTIDVSYDKAWSRAIIGEFRTVLKPKPPKEIVGAYRAHRAWRILPNGETTLERIRALRTEDTYELDLWPVAMSRMGPWRPGWNIASGYNSLRGGQGGFYALHSIAEVFKQARVEQGYSN